MNKIFLFFSMVIILLTSTIAIAEDNAILAQSSKIGLSRIVTTEIILKTYSTEPFFLKRGIGVILDGKHILTTAHGVKPYVKHIRDIIVTVKLSNNGRTKIIRPGAIKMGYQRDLLLLRDDKGEIQKFFKNPVQPLIAAKSVKIGDPMILLTRDKYLGDGRVEIRGRISGLFENGEASLAMEGSVLPGHSGSPLITLDEKLGGITRGYLEHQGKNTGFGYAVSIIGIRAFLKGTGAALKDAKEPVSLAPEDRDSSKFLTP